MLLSGPMSLICLKLAKSIFMPQACCSPLPWFHFTGPSLTPMACPKEENKRAESTAMSPASEKTQEAGKKNWSELNKQHPPRKLNTSGESANWESQPDQRMDTIQLGKNPVVMKKKKKKTCL